ncbi:hypothetical protein FOQG_08379 [Fusarium oxysporum f. sp. raphani 54005]|uniref:Uncharacterized protein n=2 Tax=Fusarium oxysporum TaxID=5507 RepID=X0D1M8_FUSOX|nr:hypothetical protein FOVG_02374 [Fusarium oxysporum f. sp. pisi HDV247]EXK88587.1 hypothetical protein FOQG_08379 [Fusarium oxysporum f. sp. raphani 54005]KAK2701015.1 hypothetical protein QWA68_000453 [Fusarium oxysporum]
MTLDSSESSYMINVSSVFDPNTNAEFHRVLQSTIKGSSEWDSDVQEDSDTMERAPSRCSTKIQCRGLFNLADSEGGEKVEGSTGRRG